MTVLDQKVRSRILRPSGIAILAKSIAILENSNARGSENSGLHRQVAFVLMLPARQVEVSGLFLSNTYIIVHAFVVK